MPFNIDTFMNSFTNVFSNPFITWIYNNPFIISILLTICILITVAVMLDPDIDSTGYLKLGVTIFIINLLLLWIHDTLIMKNIEEKHKQPYSRVTSVIDNSTIIGSGLRNTPSKPVNTHGSLEPIEIISKPANEYNNDENKSVYSDDYLNM